MFQLLLLLAVFDIAPIKLAENHRLSLAPTLRWGGRPLSLMAMPQQTTSGLEKNLNKWQICVMHWVNGGTLRQDSFVVLTVCQTNKILAMLILGRAFLTAILNISNSPQ